MIHFQDLLNFDDPLNVEASQQFEENKVNNLQSLIKISLINLCIYIYIYEK